MSKDKKPQSVYESIVEGGCRVFVRTVTFHYIGTVHKYHDCIKAFEIHEISAVFSSGDLTKAYTTGCLERCEKLPREVSKVMMFSACSDIDLWPFSYEETKNVSED